MGPGARRTRIPSNLRGARRLTSLVIPAPSLRSIPQAAQIVQHLFDAGHVAEVDINVVEEDFVHQFAAFADGFAGDNDAKAVGGVAAGGVDAMACADASNY